MSSETSGTSGASVMTTEALAAEPPISERPMPEDLATSTERMHDELALALSGDAARMDRVVRDEDTAFAMQEYLDHRWQTHGTLKVTDVRTPSSAALEQAAGMPAVRAIAERSLVADIAAESEGLPAPTVPDQPLVTAEVPPTGHSPIELMLLPTKMSFRVAVWAGKRAMRLLAVGDQLSSTLEADQPQHQLKVAAKEIVARDDPEVVLMDARQIITSTARLASTKFLKHIEEGGTAIEQSRAAFAQNMLRYWPKGMTFSGLGFKGTQLAILEDKFPELAGKTE